MSAVRARIPVDDREERCVTEVLAALERSEDDPFDEHANPVHVTASALIVGRGGLMLQRHQVLRTWVAPGGHIDADERPWAGGAHTHLDLRCLVDGDDADPAPPPDESRPCSGSPAPEALRIAEPSMAGILTHLGRKQ